MSAAMPLQPDHWRALRARYQRGLLRWLQRPGTPEGQAGMAAMQGALLDIEANQGDALFWGLAHTLLNALANGALPVEGPAQRLCGRFDRQLRLLEQGATTLDRDLVSATFDFATNAIFAPAAAVIVLAKVINIKESARPQPPAADQQIPPTATPKLSSESTAEATQAADSPSLADFSVLLLPSDEVALDPSAVASWELAGRHVAEAWSARHQAGLGPFRSAAIKLCGAAVAICRPEALLFAETLATVADRADEPEIFADPRLAAAVSALLEVLVAPGSVKRKIFSIQSEHLTDRLNTCLCEAALPPEGRLIVSRTLYQMFVGEAQESLTLLRDELETLQPQNAEMASAASSLADNAGTIDLSTIRDLAMSLANALVRYQSPLNLELPDERALVTKVLQVLTEMVECVAAEALPEEDTTLLEALRIC